MKIELGFGNGLQTLEVPDANVSEILVPNEIDTSLSAEEAVSRALENPIGSPRLRDMVKPGEKIAIVTSDITRPMPTYAVMPFLFKELEAAGVSDKDVTLVFALGSHRKHTDEEKIKLAGEETFKRIACIDGDVKDCIHLGTTVRGTPVDIVRTVAEADKRICLGNIEYHYFAGYSGGAKAIMPGVSTRDAIQSNHRMMIEKEACAGNLDTNPLRQDIEEAARICGVDFILNVVLDEHKKIIYAVAGDLVKSHREGCRFLDTLYGKRIKQKADIVVVSQGGAPKDLNLYQTQKALDNAKHAVKDGGIIILVGSCKEGLGEKVFEEWMTSAEKPEDLVLRIKREFKLGGHKAAAIALVLEYADIYLVSDMEEDFVKKLFFMPFKTVQTAFNAAFEKKGANASVLVMPYGGSTLPKL
ncbi:nickel-dependent lactate racemase [Treponema sp. HNW]|uniref:nickel-dependent lactate racemase n=1 Tax=Treponema sp. HNW TaxID=3116654 RepID=UPI003D09BB3D